MKYTVCRRSIVLAAEGQVSCDLAQEVVILDVKSGIYYGLNEVGARVWNLIQEARSVSEVCAILLEEYEVDPERCEHELLLLFQDLATKGLIEVKNEMDT